MSDKDDQPEIKDEWKITEGRYDGHDIIVRFNVGVQGIVGGKRYPFRVGIAIPLQKPNKNGMPQDDEFLVLRKMEDEIYDYFDVAHRGVTCVVITTQGMRELIIYSKKNDVSELIKILSQGFPSHDIQHYVEKDKDWEGYQQWIL